MKKYILQTSSQGEPLITYSSDIKIDEDTYECVISLTIHPVDGIADDFIRNVYVISKQKIGQG
ncbi:MAG: hypothetical protein NTV32_09845 [Gammaproteobacteria bacterium]|nr:hypothetical protein [Gammaproteobacteria bacterium]